MYGPIYNRNAVIVSVDDDVIYSKDLVHQLVLGHLRYGGMTCFVGYSFERRTDRTLYTLRTQTKPLFKKDALSIEAADRNVFCPIGVGSLLIPPLSASHSIYEFHFEAVSRFGSTELAMMTLPAMKSGRPYIQDNIETGFWCELNKIPITLLRRTRAWGTGTDAMAIDSYSASNDQLRRTRGVEMSAVTYDVLRACYPMSGPST
jgi:hypothetical protein